MWFHMATTSLITSPSSWRPARPALHSEVVAGASRSGGRPSGRRRAAGTLGLALLAALGLTLVLGSAPALATSTPSLFATASSNTSVGRILFDHTNLSGAVTPTGTITFRLYGPGDTSCQSPLFTQTITVSGTGSDDSSQTIATSAGTFGWIASYSGDANNNPVATRCGDSTQSVIVEKISPVVSVAPALTAGAIHAAATVQYGYAPVTGTITFTVTGPNDSFCSGPPVYTRTVTINGDGSYDSGSYAPTAPGTYTYRIRYDGDTNNYGVGPTACLDQSAAITVTQDQIAPARAAFTYPASGGVKDTSTPFSWTAVAGAQKYALSVGSAMGGNDLAAVVVPGSTQSYDVAMLPTGRTLYARLSTLANGTWSGPQDVSFTATDGAAFTSPSSGQTSMGMGPLAWSDISTAQDYALWVGTTPGSSDLASVVLSPDTNTYDLPLPVGRQVYAWIWTMVNGAWARYQSIAFTAGQGATFTSPTDGQRGVDASRPLSWRAVSGAQYYAVWAGTAPGGSDLAAAAVPAGTTSYTVAGMPSGRALYARVWTMISGHWKRYQDISYTTA
ncbi:MAG: hypothetical protein QOF77_1005 [Solirubrobacteraceae bacterium]|jgi:hypothetical protein|nr:hypothetical protein [Solirubrobacteraceae bacterium]